MRFSYRTHRLIIPLLLSLSGCANQSELASIRLDPTHPKYATQQCRDSMTASEVHKDIKTATMVASPALIVLSGGLLLPLVAMNAGFDTADRMNASEMSERCGGQAQTSAEIATDVAAGAALGLAAGIPVK